MITDTHLELHEDTSGIPVVALTKDQLDQLADRVASIMTGDGWMSTDQVCRWLQIKSDYLYHLVADDKIPYVKLGRLLRFRRSELEQWIDGLRTTKDAGE
jgi:excisionase family DNA binding protein